MGNIAGAEQIYASIKYKGTRLAPQGMVEIKRMLDISKSITQQVYQPEEDKGISSISSVPQEYGLSDNYPNPFNPVTKISYSIPEDARVSLKIYNVLGQEVKTLVDEYQVAGTKSVSFNSGDLPSGVYFYQLQTNKFTGVKKMLIVR
jgi:hypothetical protein